MLRGVNGNYVMNNFHMSLWLALSYKHFMTNITRVLVLEIWDKVKNFTELNNLPGLQLQLTWFWMGYGFEWVHKLKIIITIKHWTYLYCLTLKWFKYYIQVALRFAKYVPRIEPVVKKKLTFNFPVLFHELFFPPWFLDESFKYCTDSAIV